MELNTLTGVKIGLGLLSKVSYFFRSLVINPFHDSR